MAFGSSAFLLFLLTAVPLLSHAEIPEEVAGKIKLINAKGDHYGLVVSGEAELNVVLAQGWFRPDKDLPALDISARRFRVGEVQGCRTILAMSGSGSVNAAQTTQLLLTHFRVKAVIHYGRAASARPNDLSIGDISIPRQFAHTGVWYWEKFGGDEGSFTREIANLTFSKYNVGQKSVNNKLQSVYFQPETVYSVKGKPEVGNAKFWFHVDDKLFAAAQEIEDTNLDRCVGRSLICLEQQPKIKRVEKGGSANLYAAGGLDIIIPAFPFPLGTVGIAAGGLDIIIPAFPFPLGAVGIAAGGLDIITPAFPFPLGAVGTAAGGPDIVIPAFPVIPVVLAFTKYPLFPCCGAPLGHVFNAAWELTLAAIATPLPSKVVVTGGLFIPRVAMQLRPLGPKVLLKR